MIDQPLAPRCNICGGNVGRLPVEGWHWLCYERRKRGIPTPSLGERCIECRGIGCKPRSAVGPMLFTSGSSPAIHARAIEAWAPKCTRCDGSGVEPKRGA